MTHPVKRLREGAAQSTRVLLLVTPIARLSASSPCRLSSNPTHNTINHLRDVAPPLYDPATAAACVPYAHALPCPASLPPPPPLHTRPLSAIEPTDRPTVRPIASEPASQQANKQPDCQDVSTPGSSGARSREPAHRLLTTAFQIQRSAGQSTARTASAAG